MFPIEMIRHLLTVEELITFKRHELAWKASWVTRRMTISVMWWTQKLDWNDSKNWRFLSFRILTCCVRPKPFKMSRKWLWILGSQYGCWNYHGEWVVRWRTQEWTSQLIWLRRKNWFWEAGRWRQLQVTDFRQGSLKAKRWCGIGVKGKAVMVDHSIAASPT